MKTGIELIAEERQEQIEKHGYDVYHDIQHTYMDLINASKAYMYRDPYSWPFEKESFKTGSNIDSLKKAGAFLAAAIDRLQNND